MPPSLSKRTSFNTFVEGIKINAASRQVRDGKRCWVKRRRWFAAPVLALANAFFRLTKSPVRVLPDVAAWQQWEVASFVLLHGPEWRAFPEGRRSAVAEELPGTNVTSLLDSGTLTPRVALAVGRELRRAHEVFCEEFRGPWSHGDPHAGNFIYDEAAQRARLIDFEVCHLLTASASARHLDDVLAFLLDLLGRSDTPEWLPNALSFLEGYGDIEIASHLTLPRGCARLWWAVRASFLCTAELRSRLDTLRRELILAHRAAE